MADNFTTAELDAPNYRWEHKKIKMFIFSTTNYTPGKLDKKSNIRQDDSEERQYEIGVLRMKKQFNDLCASEGIDVDIEEKDDSTEETHGLIKILDGLKNKESSRHLGYDCYFFVFFTYLSNKDKTENVLRFNGQDVSLNDIWERIREVPQFQGKPKIFLIQADDLSLVQQGQLVIRQQAAIERFVERRIPIDADRLIILSKLPRMLQTKPLPVDPPLRNQKEEGCLLIQAFLKVLEENKAKKTYRLDLLNLTTEINREIREMIKFIKFSNPDKLPRPFVSSTLTKCLYL